MNQKRFMGFTLVLAGVLISLSRIAVTGAVVGIESSSILGAVGAMIIFIGFIQILAARKR